MFDNIERFYNENRELLLESDDLRPSKSVTRDVSETINKFTNYYLQTQSTFLSTQNVLSALSLSNENDTFNTNIRVLKEFNFITEEENGYKLTNRFVEFVLSTETADSFILKKLTNIRGLNSICMYTNLLLCCLREGYKENVIISFPESAQDFVNNIPSLDERNKYRQKVKELYGFSSRAGHEADDYTPNANYRVLTQLRKMNLITKDSSKNGLDFYKLTKKSYSILNTIDNNLMIKNAKNIIYYGFPGCGKSWYVEHSILPQSSSEKDNIFRTTFYLDYSNTDFIGQIYPTINGDIVEYKQVPGPFTKALERALRYKENTIYLVIEEINRGNAAAIFGDLFQLLDRLKENYDERVAGDSEYPISNEFIEGYFQKQNKIYEANGEAIIDYKPGNIYIPHNMVIYATMNTSDQNVFPLDTAFKRRWQRERILSDWSDNNKIKNYRIPGTNYSWEQFAKGVNNSILKNSSNSSISEDKCLGSYFVNENMLICGNEIDDDTKENKLFAFVNNVLDYLYNDVTKFDHTILFTNIAESYEKMFNEIMLNKKSLDLSKWLKDDVIKEIEAIEVKKI